MNSKNIIAILLTFFLLQASSAQFCSLLGGSPNGAYHVCGNITLSQPNGFPCGGNHEIYVPGCTGRGFAYFDKNPYWYSFTCFQTGVFGFEVTPNTLTDDFDWQLFDVTGINRLAVYFANQAPVTAANWANTSGATGASATGANIIQCESDIPNSRNSYAAMPTLQVGHDYLLLLCHTHGNGGYTIAFGTTGTTASITDPAIPHVKSVSTSCPGSPLTVKFTKKVRCNSIGMNSLPLSAAEFRISPNLANVIGGIKIGCDNSYETDSVIIFLDNLLSPGNYDLVIQIGYDGNTILDFCDQAIPDGERFPFIVPPIQYPHMDSIIQPGCSPIELQLFFKTLINCSTISPNGSQFIITGSTPVSVIHANGSCTAGPLGGGQLITLKLAAPIFGKGSFQIRLKTGDDGNQLSDQCGLKIPDGETVNFVTKDTVNANFNYVVHLGCKQDTINFSHDGKNEVNVWNWTFDGTRTSVLQNPQVLYDTFGLKRVQLTVSNGGCSATSTVNILLDNELKAGFETMDLVCPGQVVLFKDTSKGNIISRLWTFGNGNSSTLRIPPTQVYAVPSVTYTAIAELSIQNSLGCTSIARKNITIADRCYVFVPGAFTPNNDGLNDYLYPLNVHNVSSFRFIVYNRYGQIVFETENLADRWDGRYKGQVADPGTYLWTLHYIDASSGKITEQRGTTILIR